MNRIFCLLVMMVNLSTLASSQSMSVSHIVQSDGADYQYFRIEKSQLGEVSFFTPRESREVSLDFKGPEWFPLVPEQTVTTVVHKEEALIGSYHSKDVELTRWLARARFSRFG